MIFFKIRKHAKFYKTLDLMIHYLCMLSLNIDNQSPQLTSRPAKTESTGIIMRTAESTWTAEEHNFITLQSNPDWHVNMKNQYQIHYVLYICVDQTQQWITSQHDYLSSQNKHHPYPCKCMVSHDKAYTS